MWLSLESKSSKDIFTKDSKTARQQYTAIRNYRNYRPSSILDVINPCQETHAGLQRLLWPRYLACRWGHWWSSQCNSGYIMVNVGKALWVWDQVCCHKSHWNAPKSNIEHRPVEIESDEVPNPHKFGVTNLLRKIFVGTTFLYTAHWLTDAHCMWPSSCKSLCPSPRTAYPPYLKKISNGG